MSEEITPSAVTNDAGAGGSNRPHSSRASGDDAGGQPPVGANWKVVDVRDTIRDYPGRGANRARRGTRGKDEWEVSRRRAMLLGLGVLLLTAVIASAALIDRNTGPDNPDADPARSDSAAGATSAPTSGSGDTGTTASNPDRSTTPSTAETQAGSAPLSLPAADPNLPPQEAIGYFRAGKLRLEGSIPTVEAAAGYLRKAVDVLGEDNVIMAMKLDPRAPVGPARVVVEEQFRFPSGSTDIDPKFNELLAIGAYALEKVPEATLVITGYTDNIGDAEENQALSQRRAQAIVDYMVARGIPSDRVIAVGRGEASPVADNTTPEGRAQNRRIEGTLEGIMP